MARDYKKEYAEYHSSEKQKHNRALRNAARRKREDEGLVRKGDGKDVDHKRPLDRGGSNDRSNLRVQSKSKNRGFRRDSNNQPR
jgi:5-methylcytosine-specific restriction endonuclease McrA